VQAVLALREAVLGRWALLGRPAQQATLHFLLHLALGAARQPGPLLRAQVNGAAAAIIKRGWLEAAGEEQAAPLLAIHSLSTQAGTAEARRAGLELLTAVVEEFSPATASTMGLSWWVEEGGGWVRVRGGGVGVAAAPPGVLICTSKGVQRWPDHLALCKGRHRPPNLGRLWAMPCCAPS
jgi:hypothetical protein